MGDAIYAKAADLLALSDDALELSGLIVSELIGPMINFELNSRG
jgi:hypothetical protein